MEEKENDSNNEELNNDNNKNISNNLELEENKENSEKEIINTNSNNNLLNSKSINNSINTTTNEEKVISEYTKLLEEVKKIRNKADISYNENNKIEAQNGYIQCIEKLTNFYPSYEIQEINSKLEKLLLEKKELTIIIYSNLSVCLRSQNKFKEAINIVKKILYEYDNDHLFSYLRALSWMIESNDFQSANEFMQIIVYFKFKFIFVL